MGCRHEMVAHKYKYPRISYGENKWSKTNNPSVCAAQSATSFYGVNQLDHEKAQAKRSGLSANWSMLMS